MGANHHHFFHDFHLQLIPTPKIASTTMPKLTKKEQQEKEKTAKRQAKRAAAQAAGPQIPIYQYM